MGGSLHQNHPQSSPPKNTPGATIIDRWVILVSPQDEVYVRTVRIVLCSTSVHPQCCRKTVTSRDNQRARTRTRTGRSENRFGEKKKKKRCHFIPQVESTYLVYVVPHPIDPSRSRPPVENRTKVKAALCRLVRYSSYILGQVL